MAEVTKGLTEKLISKLMNSGSSDAERTTAARGLIPFHKHHDEILPAFKEVLAGTNALALKRDLIAVLGGVDDPTIGAMIVDGFAALPSELQGVAFDQIVRRPSRSIRMLNLLEKAEIDPAVLNPGNLARLRNHPAKGVARRAKAVLDRLSPASLLRVNSLPISFPRSRKQAILPKANFSTVPARFVISSATWVSRLDPLSMAWAPMDRENFSLISSILTEKSSRAIGLITSPPTKAKSCRRHHLREHGFRHLGHSGG